MLRVIAVIALVALAGCDSGKPRADQYTLYRNSPFDYSLRVHWASFDARESDPAYNMSNCMMAARLLNANVNAFAEREGKKRDESAGFWCEPGAFREKGQIPYRFLSEYPTE